MVATQHTDTVTAQEKANGQTHTGYMRPGPAHNQCKDPVPCRHGAQHHQHHFMCVNISRFIVQHPHIPHPQAGPSKPKTEMQQQTNNEKHPLRDVCVCSSRRESMSAQSTTHSHTPHVHRMFTAPWSTPGVQEPHPQPHMRTYIGC